MNWILLADVAVFALLFLTAFKFVLTWIDLEFATPLELELFEHVGGRHWRVNLYVKDLGSSLMACTVWTLARLFS